MKNRWWLVILTIISYALVYYRPMWSFQFLAPQYPDGLELQVYMTGAQGDVTEIDIINHYIGMQKLEDAAKNERALAPYVLIFLSLLTVIVAIKPRHKLSKILYLPIMGFPIAFVLIFYLWLYRFGHELNPAAPVKLIPFTPTILGTGIIGQFRTFALPGIGFYLACFSAILTGLMLYYYNCRKNYESRKTT